MAAYKYLFTDKKTGETVEVFDVADLAYEGDRRARLILEIAYGEEDENLTDDDYEPFDASELRVPCFRHLSGWELSGWCEWHDIMFEADGTPHWAADGSWSRVRLTNEVYGDNIYSFADLPSDEARYAALNWCVCNHPICRMMEKELQSSFFVRMQLFSAGGAEAACAAGGVRNAVRKHKIGQNHRGDDQLGNPLSRLYMGILVRMIVQ